MAINFGGLLSNPALLDIGTGLLAQSGYSQTPVTLGQAFGGAMQFANSRQAERIQLDAMRSQLEQEQQKKQAFARLQQLTAPQTTPGPVKVPAPSLLSTPEGQAEFTGLLGTLAPEAMVQGLVAQQFKQQEAPRVSTDLTTFEALNPQLKRGTPEFRDEFLKFTAEADDPTGALMQQAELQLLTNELALAREERQKAKRDEQQEFQTTRRSIMTDINHLVEMAEINSRLEGTALETGLPLPDVRRAMTGGVAAIQSLLGVDTATAAQLKEDFDTFKKYSTDFVVGSLDRLAGGGAITQGKFDALIQSNANIGASPGTNNTIIANNLEALLEGAEIGGYEIPATSAERARELLGKLRGATRAANPPASALLSTPADSAQAEIDALNAEIRALEEQLRGL